MNVSEFMTQQFSFSKLSCASKCLRKFFYRYVCGKRESTGPQLYGRAVHIGQEFDNEEKVKGRRVPIGEVLDRAVEELRAECGKEGVSLPIDPFAAEHKRQLELYEASGLRGRVRPVPGTIEASFEIDLEVAGSAEEPKIPCKMQGFCDVVSQETPNAPKEVIDYKTGSKPLTQYDADNSLQFQLYALAAKAPKAKAITFVRSGKQKATVKVTKDVLATEARQMKLLTWIADSVHSIRRCLKSGDYPKCDPGCFYCPACDFYDLCYGKNPEIGKVIQVTGLKPVGECPQPEWRKRK